MSAFTPTPAREREPGTITTFYSYKGGTGRTMALANTACVLAERLAPDEKVLVVDWDLEAPGLHRYFPPRLRTNDPGQDMGLDAGPGLIDLFIDLSEQLPDEPAHDRAQADAAVERAVAALDWQAYIGQTEHAAIHILRAGRNDDGGYGRRVNTFGWEQLFQRAPGIYRAFAERLARDYRWVLIDSRTGVTDISGICTSLLPEKLVVVFTPNRQSLTGVRELVQTATAYRRGHDDLRPLLVLPLPSRIEASMEKLRTHWRHGRPEDGITGYQPMFQNLLAECYDLADCDLGAYFDAVQIQQTPDCAYGEVISVRSGSSDRFSLASSYRVFVDRLTAATPPWEPLDAEPFASYASPPLLGSGTPLPSSTPPLDRPLIPVDFDPFEPPRTADAPDPFADPFSLPVAPPKATTASRTPPQPSRQRVFLSHASEDRARVDPVASLLRADGFEVFNPRDVQAGKRWDDQIAEALDQSDVVVVFWSQSAFASEAVRVEAEEGQRRGVMLPVLLDEARPPISFRGVQAADLRRDYQGQLPVLMNAIARIARAAPGDFTTIAPASSFRPELYAPPAEKSMTPQAMPSAAPGAAPGAAPSAVHAGTQSPPLPPSASGSASGSAPPMAPASARTVASSRRGRGATALGIAAALLAVVLWWVLRPAADSRPSPSAANPPAAVAVPATYMVSVPDLLNRDTAVAAEIANSLKLRLAASDEQGYSLDALPAGLVLSQSPEAGTRVAEGTIVQLKVATRTATVPSVGGLSLGDALARLRTAGLDLGKVETVVGSGARAGTVVRQTPQAGTTVPQGSKIGVGVADEARPARAQSKLQPSREGAAAAGKAAEAAKK